VIADIVCTGVQVGLVLPVSWIERLAKHYHV
jgi:uncharacterized protein YsxB (DUF464 family)